MTDKSAKAPAPDPGVCRWPDCLHTAKGQCKTDTTITRLTAEVERLTKGRETMGNLWAKERAARVAAEAEVGWLEAARAPEMADEITNLRAAQSNLIGTNRMLKQQVEDRDTTITRLTAEVERLTQLRTIEQSHTNNVLADNERLRAALVSTTVSLVAAISLLERGGKKAAPSNTMFLMMLADYQNAVNEARAALKDPRT